MCFPEVMFGRFPRQKTLIYADSIAKKGTGWTQVANATLDSDIIYQKKGVAYGPISQVKY